MSTVDPSRMPSRAWAQRALVLGAWTLLGTLIAGEYYIRARLRGESPGVAVAFLPLLLWAYTWALFTPLIVSLGRRFPFDRERWPKSLVVHFCWSLGIVWIASLVYNAADQFVGGAYAGIAELLLSSIWSFVLFLHFDPMLYWIVLGLSLLARHYQESRERELRASQLETQLAEARLQALEMQLRPHFLFNALNTITALVRTNRNTQAIRVTTRLGDLLRHVLDSTGTQFVPLKQEIDFIQRYLEVEQVRFGDRLKVDWRVDPDTREAGVPFLILQPLVENAIQHGIATRAAAGCLLISARRQHNRLQLAVRDDGPGLSADRRARKQDGVGLSATKERLFQLYGDDHDFQIHNVESGGVLAEIDIPFRVSADARPREA